jgi:acyl-coenzyme A thioesterase PaaI-like protein
MSEDSTILDRIAGYRDKLEHAPGTWPAKRELASAVRELMDCLCATDAPEEELLSIADQVRESARRFSSQPTMTNPPGVAEGSLAGGMEMFMDRSPILGLSNPMAPPLSLTPDHEDKVIRGEVTFGNAYEGAPGCVHGGYLAAAFDELLGMACIFSGGPGMTGELVTRYRRPTPTRTRLRFEGRLDRIEGRKLYTSGEIYAGDRVTAEASGIFISITRDKFDELNAQRAARKEPA